MTLIEYSTTLEYTFFSSAHRLFIKTDYTTHMLSNEFYQTAKRRKDIYKWCYNNWTVIWKNEACSFPLIIKKHELKMNPRLQYKN